MNPYYLAATIIVLATISGLGWMTWLACRGWDHQPLDPLE